MSEPKGINRETFLKQTLGIGAGAVLATTGVDSLVNTAEAAEKVDKKELKQMLENLRREFDDILEKTGKHSTSIARLELGEDNFEVHRILIRVGLELNKEEYYNLLKLERSTPNAELEFKLKAITENSQHRLVFSINEITQGSQLEKTDSATSALIENLIKEIDSILAHSSEKSLNSFKLTYERCSNQLSAVKQQIGFLAKEKLPITQELDIPELPPLDALGITDNQSTQNIKQQLIELKNQLKNSSNKQVVKKILGHYMNKL